LIIPEITIGIKAGIVTVKFIVTKDQLADIFTKALSVKVKIVEVY
jgi:hypothetical protein